jgi:hypothetical protein
MFDFIFGGKKKLNLIRELVEQRMRSSGFNDLESRLQAKNLSNVVIASTPEAAIVSIIEVTLKLQKKHLFLSQILATIENRRKTLGSDPYRFSQILEVTQSRNVEEASTAVLLYCIYRVGLENTGFPIPDAQIAKTFIQAANALSGFDVYPPDVVDDLLDTLQDVGDEISLLPSNDMAPVSHTDHVDEEFVSDGLTEPAESIMSTCSKCSEELEIYKMLKINSEYLCEQCNKVRLREAGRLAREEEERQREAKERLARKEEDRRARNEARRQAKEEEDQSDAAPRVAKSVAVTTKVSELSSQAKEKVVHANKSEGKTEKVESSAGWLFLTIFLIICFLMIIVASNETDATSSVAVPNETNVTSSVAAPPAAYDNGRVYPADLFYSSFPVLSQSTYLNFLEATIKVANDFCVLLEPHRIFGAMGRTLEEDMQNTARILDGEIFNAGGNSYVIDAFSWVDVGNATNDTVLTLNIRSLLCSE